MVRLFIVTQDLDRSSEFLVGVCRCLNSRLRSGLQRIVNGLTGTFITVNQGLVG
jgi:hypothetical protein